VGAVPDQRTTVDSYLSWWLGVLFYCPQPSNEVAAERRELALGKIEELLDSAVEVRTRVALPCRPPGDRGAIYAEMGGQFRGGAMRPRLNQLAQLGLNDVHS